MKKELTKDLIFKKHFNGQRSGIRFKEFAIDLQPDDIIEIDSEPAFYGSDSGYDAFTEIRVYRKRLQTDEEFAESKRKLDKRLEQSKKDRYESYLKLKKEFEPDVK